MADLLPPNASPYLRAISQVDARILAVESELVRLVKRPETCPAELLPYLALERAVRVWDSAWSEAVQRAVIAASYRVHAIGGTRGALEAALEPHGYAITVREWFEYGGGPYRFRLAIDLPEGAGWSAREQSIVVRTTRSAKNTRSRLERIDVAVTGPAGALHVGAFAATRVRIRPSIEPVSYVAGRPAVYAGAAFASAIRIKPKAA